MRLGPGEHTSAVGLLRHRDCRLELFEARPQLSLPGFVRVLDRALGREAFEQLPDPIRIAKMGPGDRGNRRAEARIDVDEIVRGEPLQGLSDRKSVV